MSEPSPKAINLAMEAYRKMSDEPSNPLFLIANAIDKAIAGDRAAMIAAIEAAKYPEGTKRDQDMKAYDEGLDRAIEEIRPLP